MHDLNYCLLVFSLLSPLAVAGCGAPALSLSSSSSTSPSPAPAPPPDPAPPAPSGASLSISSPAPGASVVSPFTLSAAAAVCSSQDVTQMGFVLDSAVGDTTVNGASLHTGISAAAGSHTLTVKAWGSDGALCTASVAITVASPLSPTGPVIPANAILARDLQALSNWKAANDPAAGASSSGTTAIVDSPSLSGYTREFDTAFSNSGGELYYISYGSDPKATNFLYDGWLYLTASADSIANLEMDMNQVMSNGQTVIYGFQCDGYSGTWDYTENAGSPANPVDHWLHSSAACNVRKWAQNTWHHVQVTYSRDNIGNVTYHSVWLDGTESSIDATAPSAFALGWAPVLLSNFQVDGLGDGKSTVYLDRLTIARW